MLLYCATRSSKNIPNFPAGQMCSIPGVLILRTYDSCSSARPSAFYRSLLLLTRPTAQTQTVSTSDLERIAAPIIADTTDDGERKYHLDCHLPQGKGEVCVNAIIEIVREYDNQI
jgi:hypothetical protein